ncbi:MAG: hypothetical protein AAFX10_14715, partial [Pseudomonadota bacterium]
MRLFILTTGASLLFLASPFAFAADEPDPLFASHERLELRLTAPMTTLMRERPDDEELDGTVSFSDGSGQTVQLSVEIRTRGNYRRQQRICPFAPLRLDFKRSEVEDTLFDKQDKVKLVTHCRNAIQNEQAAMREYLVYRMFNQLTELSYLVRPLNITYVDTEKNGRENKRFGFLIESKERFGERTGWPEYEIGKINAATLEPGYSNLVGVFQYFAGNTDYSMISSPDKDDCCHNTQLYGDESQAIAVPYDFDQSGLVDAAYASPNPRLERSSR